MTFAVGRLFLSPPVTGRALLSSSNSPLPQCQLRRQNHSRRGLNFHVAPTRKEAILNPGFGLDGINMNTISNTLFLNSFCPMYFVRRRCISSALGSTPPEEQDSDNDVATMEKKEEEEKTTTKKDYGNDDDSNKDVGYILLATLGWFILGWMCPDFYDQLCRVVGRILEAILRPFCWVVGGILEAVCKVVGRILDVIVPPLCLVEKRILDVILPPLCWVVRRILDVNVPPLCWVVKRIFEAISSPFVYLTMKMVDPPPRHSTTSGKSFGEVLYDGFITVPGMWISYWFDVWLLALLLFVATVLLLLLVVWTWRRLRRRCCGSNGSSGRKDKISKF